MKTLLQVTAAEFAKSHNVDSDWVTAMNGKLITLWERGDQIQYSGFQGSIVRHYHNGMFEIRLASGIACVDHSDIKSA
jgi:hypothetical protein